MINLSSIDIFSFEKISQTLGIKLRAAGSRSKHAGPPIPVELMLQIIGCLFKPNSVSGSAAKLMFKFLPERADMEQF